MIELREIIALTALNFGYEPTDLIADNRKKEVTLARHVAMYVARRSTPRSTTEIGRAFRRDHTTVLHGIEKIEAEVRAAPAGPLAALVKSLIRNIEFSERIEAFGGIDVLDVARRIAANPVRQAMSASVMEVSALAGTVVDLWEIAQAAERLAEAGARIDALRGRGIINLDEVEVLELDDAERLRAALGAAIADELAAMRGPSALREPQGSEQDPTQEEK